MQFWARYKMRVAATIGVLVALSSCTLAGLAVWDSRKQALDSARVVAENLALVVQRDLARTFQTYALSIDGTVKVLTSGILDGLSNDLTRLALFDNAANSPDLGAIVVVDPAGHIRYDSRSDTPRGGNFADREHFQSQVAADMGLSISAPFISRLDDAWSVAISRRVNNPDGSFGGVVIGTIKLSALNDLFASVAHGTPGASISLFRTDGVALVRWPFDEKDIGKNFSNVGLFRALEKAPFGTFDQVAVRDGVARRYVYAKIGDLPLVLSIGLSFDDILAPWRTKAMLLGAIALIVLALLAALAIMLVRELRLRRAAENKALASASRFLHLAVNSNDAIVVRDVLGNRTYASPKFFEFIGRSEEEVGSNRLSAFLHPDSRSMPMMTIRRLLGGEQNVSELLQCERPDGSMIWLEAVSRLVRQSDDQPPEIVTNMRDVTDHKNLTDAVARRKAELEEIALRDPLTAIANRRAFDDAYRTELIRAERGARTMSLLMIDVDHFKIYNDRLGHLAGDEALKKVAQCINTCARRPGDLAARFGGEEFVLLLPDTDVNGAMRMAEKVRQAVIELNIAHPHAGLLSVSIGAATSSLGQLRNLLDAADHALYRAKDAGRNRVHAAEPGSKAA